MEYIGTIWNGKLNKKTYSNLRNNFFDEKQKINRFIPRFNKLFLILILLILKSNNDLKPFYLFNKVVNNENVKLINLNYTKKQYARRGLEFLHKIKNENINNKKKQKYYFE